MIKSWMANALGEDIPCHSNVMSSVFHAGCGFQTLAWIMNKTVDSTLTNKMQIPEAIQWRTLFAQHLRNQGLAHRTIEQIPMGGMTAEPHLQEVAKLLSQHGVASERVPTVVQQLVRQLGHPSIKAALGSARPWADLKAKASACRPMLQLVLAEELQAKIAERLQTGKPMGNRKNKAPKKAVSDQWVTPIASQVQIPTGIFKQDDGILLHQVSIHEIHVKQPGIVVLNIEEAKPFLTLQAPLSKEGVGLLILEFQDEALPAQHQVIRFPATCPETQEPMILSAALVQLGSQAVSRHLPPQPAGIEQIETKVIRAVVYRDQHPQS